jgi:S-(hydroxymethyl)glutathione dehydrogenase / alcohol dehydrogenase
MRAAVLREVGQPLSVEDIEHDEPGPFEVLVRVAAAGLCHSDVRFMEGSYPLPLPAVLGHESAGVVEAVGSSVSHVRPGDHVVTFLSVFCGSCSYCVSGQSHNCINRAATQRRRDQPPRLAKDGEPLHQFLNLASFAERMLIHENALVKVTEEIPLVKAALLGCGVATGLGAVFNTAGVRPGESVAVIGCGGVGLSAVQAARIAGAGTIIALDRIDRKLALASSLGATHTINVSEGDPVAAVKDLTDGLGVDDAFEAIGNTTTTEMAFAMLRKGGTATLIGLIPVGQKVSIPGVDLIDEKRLQGSNMGSNRFRVDIPRYVQMYLDGRLNLDDMVTATMPLDDINDGFDHMRTGQAARNLIVFPRE